MSTAQSQRADGPDPLTLFARSVELRFRTLHEDGRRDRRELMERLDRIATEFRSDMTRHFEAVDRRLEVVCDKGGQEHAAFREVDRLQGEALAALVKRMDADHERAVGRGQAFRWMSSIASGISSHWQTIVAVSAFAFAAQGYVRPQAVAAPIVAQAHAQDWPLRTLTP